MTSSIAVDEALLVLKLAFLALLYVFIWRIVASAGRDLRAEQPAGGAQESVILSPADIAELRRGQPRPRLVVVTSPVLAEGRVIAVDSAPMSFGRAAGNEIRLEQDTFVSGRHARFEARDDGLWVVDTGSTNGTFVNGERVDAPQRLERGDVVRLGETELEVQL